MNQFHFLTKFFPVLLVVWLCLVGGCAILDNQAEVLYPSDNPNSQAKALYDQGRYGEAEPFLRRALVRLAKVGLKVTGGFHAIGGSEACCILRSIWGTDELQGTNPFEPFETLRLIIEGSSYNEANWSTDHGAPLLSRNEQVKKDFKGAF